MKDENQKNTLTYGQMNIINYLRMLWMDFVMWSRVLITSEASGFEDIEAVGMKLYQIPDQFRGVFDIFFGQEIGGEIGRLFTEQLLIGVDMIRAQKQGDMEAVDENTIKLYQSGEQTAAYLAQINPYWDQQTWTDLFAEFIKTKIFETLAIGAGNYKESIAVSDSLQYQALKMANYMAAGLIHYTCG